MVNKRAQMKIQQTAFMLVAVTLFFVLAGMFILTVVFSNLKNSAQFSEQKEALLLVSKLANSPEFSCENAFEIRLGSCVDFDKIMALKKQIKNYKEFWGVEGIEIRKTYPSIGLNNQGIECLDSNYPDCNKLTLIKSSEGIGISNFVSLCRKVYDGENTNDVCEIGKLIVFYGSEK